MSENSNINQKSIEFIFKRINFRIERYPRMVLFDKPCDSYTLQNNSIILGEEEHPLYEERAVNSYVLITNLYLYSNIYKHIQNSDSPLGEFRIAIKDVKYFKYPSEILDEKESRSDYTEYVLSYIYSKDEEQKVPVRVGVNHEFFFMETLRQLVCMYNTQTKIIN